MSLEEILNAIESLEVTDLVPVLETVTAKFAESFWYIDSYVAPVEEQIPAEAAPVEEMPVEEAPVEEVPAEEDVRLSL